MCVCVRMCMCVCVCACACAHVWCGVCVCTCVFGCLTLWLMLNFLCNAVMSASDSAVNFNRPNLPMSSASSAISSSSINTMPAVVLRKKTASENQNFLFLLKSFLQDTCIHVKLCDFYQRSFLYCILYICAWIACVAHWVFVLQKTFDQYKSCLLLLSTPAT